ncbi:MAG TPA: hypothetical protein VGD91_24960 [Trebonia sp.]
MKRRISRRAMAKRIAELETANARLRDHLAVSLAITDHYLKQKLADDLAARAAEGPTSNFQQQLRSLHVYGSSIRTPFTPNIFGGPGV